MGPKEPQEGAKNGANMDQCGPLMGPKVLVEETLIADSPRPTFMTKTNEKVPYAYISYAVVSCVACCQVLEMF